MSFGFAVTDFLKVAEYSILVYKQCRDCPGQYRNLANEARQLSSILEDLADLIKDGKLTGAKTGELLNCGEGCREVLVDLETQLKKYSSLSTQSKRTWDRLAWDQEGGRELRDRLMSNVTMLNSLYQTLILSGQNQIREALDQLLTDYQGGHRDSSGASSIGTIGDDDDEADDAAWPQIIRDLEDLGISEDLATDHRTLIVDWFVQAINNGQLQEKPAETHTPEEAPWTVFEPHPLPPSPEGPGPRLPPTGAEIDKDFWITPSPSSREVDPQHAAFVSQIQSAQISGIRRKDAGVADSETNIVWTAQLIAQHWNKREWAKAEKYLSQQINDVQTGGYLEIRGAKVQPDIRLLTHLLGVAASYRGDYILAKSIFESGIRTPNESGENLDDGDIAAAWWLGDTCICLHQPENAALAYALALEGLSFGPRAHSSTHSWRRARVLSELKSVNSHSQGLTSLERTFQHRNIDASTILYPMSTANKLRLVTWTIGQLRTHAAHAPNTSRRTEAGIEVVEGFLAQPLIDVASWPLSYDPFFLAGNAVVCAGLMTLTAFPQKQISESTVPTTGLGQSNKLAYSTTKGIDWLAEILEQGLRTLDIAYKPCGSHLLCRLSHIQHNIALLDGIVVKLRKLPLRAVCGFKVSSSGANTRDPYPSSKPKGEASDLVLQISQFLKEFCENAERTELEVQKAP